MAEPDGAADPALGVRPPRVVTRRFHGPVRGRYWVLCVVLPLVLCVPLGLTVGPELERQLERRALKSLDKAGMSRVQVSFDGRLATLYLPTGQNQRRVSTMVAKVPGVGDVDVVPAPATAEERRACGDLQARVDRATGGRRIPFVGRTARLTGEGLAMARAAAQLVRACERAEVTAGGHTDSATLGGSTLTLQRAHTLRDVLIAAGVEPANVKPRGYAAAFEIATEDTPAARASNERGSIVVTRS